MSKAERLCRAILLHFKIVWRKWDRVEIEAGKFKTLRIDWKTSWKVSKDIWLT